MSNVACRAATAVAVYVESTTHEGNFYVMELHSSRAAYCSCPAFVYRATRDEHGAPTCKHLIAELGRRERLRAFLRDAENSAA